MKTKWHFHFQTTNFVFKKEHKFIGSANGLNLNRIDNLPEKLNLEICISPNKISNNISSNQTGVLYITVPLAQDKAKLIINNLALLLSHKISFNHGNFKLLAGMITCENIPETLEEKKDIGDTPFNVEVSLLEVIDSPNFDSKEFAEISHAQVDMQLVIQHNQAKKTENPITKFLEFYKILESKFTFKNDTRTAKKVLKESKDLFNIFNSTFEFITEEEASNSFNTFIESIVDARNNCAHLKLNKDFGYLPYDSNIKKDIEPYLEVLEVLTYEVIKKNIIKIT